MARKRRVRSRDEHWRKLMLLWIIAIFFLMVFVVVDIIVVYNRLHPENTAITSPTDYSKIRFEGMAVGDVVPADALDNPVVDSTYNYSWKNISIAADEDKKITRLGFYTIESTDPEKAVSIDNISIEYRDYPLFTISDFVMYFGYTKITNFRNYKYLDYDYDGYGIHVELVEGKIYNIEVFKSSVK